MVVFSLSITAIIFLGLALNLKFTLSGDILSSKLGRKIKNMWEQFIQVYTPLVNQTRDFFWVSALCSGYMFRCFGGTHCLHLHGE